VAESSLRIDVLTGRYVIVASHRNDRPGAATDDPPLSEPPDGNPFLEGNEHKTPGERLALRRTETSPNSPGWLVRIVPNQFPVVNEETPKPSATSTGLTSNIAINGVHDVVIESPVAHRRLAELSAAEIARILLAWQRRVRDLQQQENIKSITVFRNEGFSAGASLPHVHSQMISLNTIPPQTDIRLQNSDRHRQETGRSLLSDLFDTELAQEQRIVSADDDCLVMCPYAGRVSWQVRIVPRKTAFHSFADCSESALIRIAANLHAAAMAVDHCAGPMPMNVLLVQPPVAQSADGWFLELMPRSARMAGYELATDVDIVTVAPESTARLLRNAFEKTIPLRHHVVPPSYDWLDASSTR